MKKDKYTPEDIEEISLKAKEWHEKLQKLPNKVIDMLTEFTNHPLIEVIQDLAITEDMSSFINFLDYSSEVDDLRQELSRHEISKGLNLESHLMEDTKEVRDAYFDLDNVCSEYEYLKEHISALQTSLRKSLDSIKKAQGIWKINRKL